MRQTKTSKPVHTRPFLAADVGGEGSGYARLAGCRQVDHRQASRTRHNENERAAAGRHLDIQCINCTFL